jgi:hypothetical protein
LLGFAALLIAVVCSVALTALFYELLKPVNRSISLTAAFVHLVGLAILAFSALLLLGPLIALKGEKYLSVFKVEQLHALAYMIDLPAKHNWCVDDICRLWLPDFLVAFTFRLPVTGPLLSHARATKPVPFQLRPGPTCPPAPRNLPPKRGSNRLSGKTVL